MIFICNICRRPTFSILNADKREGTLCVWCGCNARQRLISYTVSAVVNPKNANSLSLIGVSDGEVTEKDMNRKFPSAYINYQYHTEPFLDICLAPTDLHESADVVICSEVLEHVPNPVSKGFAGLFSLLKPNGTLVLSVPHSGPGGDHLEHFEELSGATLIDNEMYQGTNRQGNVLTYRDLVFHGGAGSTLEHRVFSEESLRAELLNAGFTDLKKISNKRIHGIKFEAWSRVWVAKKEGVTK